MSIAGNTINLGYGEEKAITTDRRHPVGTRGETPDGKVFYYSFSNGSIGSGNTIQQKAPVANHDMDQVLQAAASVGDQTIAITTGGTDVTIDQYGGGYIHVNDGPGEGHIYRIADEGVGGTAGRAHAARTGAGTLVITLADNEQVREAMTTADSLLGLIENLYKDVATFNSTAVGTLIGVAPTEIGDDEFFWAQTSGIASVLIEGTVILANEVMTSDGQTGAVELQNYAGTVELPTVGVVTAVVSVNTDFGFIDLKIRA